MDKLRTFALRLGFLAVIAMAVSPPCIVAVQAQDANSKAEACKEMKRQLDNADANRPGLIEAEDALGDEIEGLQIKLEAERQAMKEMAAFLRNRADITSPHWKRYIGYVVVLSRLMNETQGQLREIKSLRDKLPEEIATLRRTIDSECGSARVGPAYLKLITVTDNTAELARGTPDWQSHWVGYGPGSTKIDFVPAPEDKAAYGAMTLSWEAPPDEMRDGQTYTLKFNVSCTREPRGAAGANLVLWPTPEIFGATPAEGVNLYIGRAGSGALACKENQAEATLRPTHINSTKSDEDYVITIGLPSLWVSYHYKIER